MNNILIITSSVDISVNEVCKELDKLGSKYFRLNIDEIIFGSNFSFKKNDKIWEYFFKISGNTIQNDTFNVVWQIGTIELFTMFEKKMNNVIDIEFSKRFIKEEYRQFLLSFYILNRNKRWVNGYQNVISANQKMPNLVLASDLGLRTPKTIITNNSDEAEKFCSENNWNVIVKPFKFIEFENRNNLYYAFANKINETEFHKFKNNIALAPTMLQEYIEKDIELRVTIIGDKVFAVAINSQTNDISKNDWRIIDPSKIEHSEFTLPKEIEEKLILFNQFYGLDYSGIDLIIDKQGDFVFLECNPEGEWYWLEEILALPMAKTFAELLNSYQILD